MKYCAILGGVDLLAREHGVDVLPRDECREIGDRRASRERRTSWWEALRQDVVVMDRVHLGVAVRRLPWAAGVRTPACVGMTLPLIPAPERTSTSRFRDRATSAPIQPNPR